MGQIPKFFQKSGLRAPLSIPWKGMITIGIVSTISISVDSLLAHLFTFLNSYFKYVARFVQTFEFENLISFFRWTLQQDFHDEE